jgi:hypothetical protein
VERELRHLDNMLRSFQVFTTANKASPRSQVESVQNLLSVWSDTRSAGVRRLQEHNGHATVSHLLHMLTSVNGDREMDAGPEAKLAQCVRLAQQIRTAIGEWQLKSSSQTLTGADTET